MSTQWRTAAAKGPHLSQPTLVGCWPGSGDPEEEAGLKLVCPLLPSWASPIVQHNPGANWPGQVPEASCLSEWKYGR